MAKSNHSGEVMRDQTIISRRGFSLVEMLVVARIVAVILGIVLCGVIKALVAVRALKS